ncbi:hypothetical protein GmHk_02G005640 [Glycine max]|nr:hypothetical protein GmHk_02G005640 [Glycine max]
MAWEVRYVIVGNTINFIFPFLYPNTKLGLSPFPILLLLCHVLTWKCRGLKVLHLVTLRKLFGGRGVSGDGANNSGVSDRAPLSPVCNCKPLVVVQTTFTTASGEDFGVVLTTGHDCYAHLTKHGCQRSYPWKDYFGYFEEFGSVVEVEWLGFVEGFGFVVEGFHLRQIAQTRSLLETNSQKGAVLKLFPGRSVSEGDSPVELASWTHDGA